MLLAEPRRARGRHATVIGDHSGPGGTRASPFGCRVRLRPAAPRQENGAVLARRLAVTMSKYS